MVQIIRREQQPKQSVGQRLSEGIGKGLETAQKFAEEYKNDQQMKQRAQQIQQLTGYDISDPKLQEIVLAESLKGKEQRSTKEYENTLRKQNIKDVETPESSQVKDINKFEDEETYRDIDPFKKAKKYEALGEHNLATIAKDEAKLAIKEKSAEKKFNQDKFEADRAYHTKTSGPLLDKARTIIQKSPIRKGLLAQQRLDISSGQTEGILPFLAEKTGLEFYRDPASARFKTASKHRFIENLNSVAGGARPNMFIEQQLSGAQAQLGRDVESNQTVLDMEEFIDDLEEQRAKTEIELAKQDQKEYGYERNDIADRADEIMQKYAVQRQDEMAYDIRRRREENMNDEQLAQEIAGEKITPGTPLTLRAARILMIKNGDNEAKASKEAKKLGFTIPTESTYLRGLK